MRLFIAILCFSASVCFAKSSYDFLHWNPYVGENSELLIDFIVGPHMGEPWNGKIIGSTLYASRNLPNLPEVSESLMDSLCLADTYKNSDGDFEAVRIKAKLPQELWDLFYSKNAIDRIEELTFDVIELKSNVPQVTKTDYYRVFKIYTHWSNETKFTTEYVGINGESKLEMLLKLAACKQ